MSSMINYDSHGVTLLGTQACREQAIPLHDSSTLPPQAQLRLQKSLKLCGRVAEMIQLAPPAGAKQAGFALARCIAAHALDYDACVVPCSVLLPYARALDHAVIEVIAMTLDTSSAEMPETVLAQMILPQRFGGMQIDLPSRLCPLARAAHLIERGPGLRAQVAQWAETAPLPDGRAVADFDGVDAAMVDGLQGQLAERCVLALLGTGQPASEARALPFAAQLRPAAPDRHLLRSFLKLCAATRHEDLFAQASSAERIRLLSAGGPTAGTSFVAPLSMHGVHFADWQWTDAARWRLGMQHAGPQGSCKNQKQNGEECGEDLEPCCDHAVDCPCGPLRNARRDELADIYADIIDETGGLARREVFVPEFSGIEEAWLDVWGHGIPEIFDILLDVTVRHPRAGRYRPDSEKQAGAAASKAEAEKLDKYPAASGRHIWPVVHETWGRLGSQGELFLRCCAAAARRHGRRRGKVTGGELRRWRARLDGALQRAVAMQKAAASRGLPGRRPHRRRPLDLELLEVGAAV